MYFDVNNKIALVTGGASGIGFSLCRELLKNGARGVTIADLDPKNGKESLGKLREEFGETASIFVETDVTSKEKFEKAFEETVKFFGAVDILVNNAGLFRDKFWQKEIAINVNGTLHGILLAFHDYLTKFRQSSKAIVVNVASVNAIQPISHIPVYSGTKHAIVGFTRSWGTPDIYDKTNVRIIAICPGATETTSTLMGDSEADILTLGQMYLELRNKKISDANFSRQSSEYVAQQTLRLIKHAANGSIWVIENSEQAYQYIFPKKETMKGNQLDEV